MNAVRPVAAPASLAGAAGRGPARLAVAVLVVLVAAVGTLLLAEVPHARAAVDAYNAATAYRCGHAAAPPGVDCWSGVDGTLVGMRTEWSALGVRHTVAAVAVGGATDRIAVEPSPALACAAPGDAVVLRNLDGAVSTVFTSHGALPTAANPNVDADAVYQGGVALLATALIIPAGVTLAWLRRRRHAPPVDAGEFYAAPAVRWAALAFLVGQAADVATSAIGQAVGLSEGNALVDVFVRATGPAGFALFRLPAIVLVLLGMTQVPRRIAITVLLLLGAAFLAVGAHNAVLAAGAHGALGVCGAVRLP